jgi:hypothetical protein
MSKSQLDYSPTSPKLTKAEAVNVTRVGMRPLFRIKCFDIHGNLETRVRPDVRGVDQFLRRFSRKRMARGQKASCIVCIWSRSGQYDARDGGCTCKHTNRP